MHKFQFFLRWYVKWKKQRKNWKNDESHTTWSWQHKMFFKEWCVENIKQLFSFNKRSIKRKKKSKIWKRTMLNSSLSYKLYSTYNENLIAKKRKWAVKSRKFSYKSNATMKLYAILSRKFWKKSSHKFYNSVNRKTA